MKKIIDTPACTICKILNENMYNNCPFKNLSPKKNFLFEKGDILYKENEDANGVFSIYIGKVRMYKAGRDNNEEVLHCAGPREIIGFSMAANKGKYTHSAIAEERTRACFIIKSDFTKHFGLFTKSDNQIFLLHNF